MNTEQEDFLGKEVLYDPKIESLLAEFTESRNQLTNYMADVDKIRSKVEAIFPNDSDFRNKFVLEEKIKAMSSFFSTLLNIRQEFNKSIKEEIEIRRKLVSSEQGKGKDDIDMRELASMVEDQMIKNKKIEIEPNDVEQDDDLDSDMTVIEE